MLTFILLFMIGIKLDMGTAFFVLLGVMALFKSVYSILKFALKFAEYFG